MTSERGSQFDATGTSLSNKIAGQTEPSGKRVRIALSPTRRVIADDAPDEDPSQHAQVTEPVTAQVTVPAPISVPAVTPPTPPIPSDHDRTPSQAGSRDRDGGPLRYMCPLCDWRFHSATRRYLHLGLQHSVILPKLGGKSQDSPSGEGLYMIPVLSAVRGHNGCTLWASDKIKSAYQTVVRNAMALPQSEWPRVSSMRWGSRDDKKFVPPKNVPASHMDMPDDHQLAEFYGDNAIKIISTGTVIEHDIPPARQVTDRDRRESYDSDWKESTWKPAHHGHWDRAWGTSSWEKESEGEARRAYSQQSRSWYHDQDYELQQQR
eukprot:378126-Amphidinium_carterae.1